jgi:hypothetical protein
MTEGKLLDEADLIEITALIARTKRLEGEYLRTRSVKNGGELYIQLDGLRWRLRTEYGVNVAFLDGKSGPDGKTVA